MADIIIVVALAVAVFFVVRSQLSKFHEGQCGGGCGECPGNCAGCQGCEDPTEGKG